LSSIAIEVLDSLVLGASMIGGFCLRQIKEKCSCPEALKHIGTTSPDGPVYDFIKRSDNGAGALLFPAQGFLELIVVVFKFLEANISVARHWPRAKQRLIELLTPRVHASERIICGCSQEDHSRTLVSMIVTKLVVTFLGNYAKTQSGLEDVPKCNNNPLSRKVLKL
jgi:hypothetical protein